MDSATLGIGLEAIVNGAFARQMFRLLEHGVVATNAAGAILIMRRNGHHVVLAAHGVPGVRTGDTFGIPAGVDGMTSAGPVEIADLISHPILSKHPLVVRRPRWRWSVNVPVPLHGSPSRVNLVCGDDTSDRERPHDWMVRMQRLTETIADEIELMSEVSWQDADRDIPAPVNRVGENPLPLFDYSGSASGSGVAVEFLCRTLIAQQRMLKRGDIAYHVANRWRQSIKPWQIAALRALKKESPQALVEAAAADLEKVAKTLHVHPLFGAVVSVPCGSSGPECFADKLGRELALRLNVPFLDAFAPLPSGGASHPKKNVRRPAMVLRFAPDAPVILVDDVAASGAHIAEASRLLHGSCPAVLPLVWIAP